MTTYLTVVPTLFHIQLSSQAFSVLYIHTAGHCGYTSHSLAVLDLNGHIILETEFLLITHSRHTAFDLSLLAKLASFFGVSTGLRTNTASRGDSGTYETVRGRLRFKPLEPLDPT